VVIDDCWQGERDERGFLRPHPERFPSGMKALAGYVHARD
jgi:alpha-galactosidase